MKVVVRGSSFLATLLGSKVNAPPAAGPPMPGPSWSPILQKGHAGNVRIGMTAGEVRVRHRDLSCEIENGVVTAIRVRSHRFKTEAGIGVGDSLRALANQYRIRWSNDHVAEVDELKMKFQLQEDRIVSILVC